MDKPLIKLQAKSLNVAKVRYKSEKKNNVPVSFSTRIINSRVKKMRYILRLENKQTN